MPTINIQANVSVDVLVKAVEQLSEAELHQFTAQVLALNAKRTSPSVPRQEAELLLHVNSHLPDDMQRRYDELIVKRDAETLTTEEHTELLRLTQRAEAFDVARIVVTIADIIADAVLVQAYSWLCKRRRNWPAALQSMFPPQRPWRR